MTFRNSKGDRIDEADGHETNWEHQARGILEAAYGAPSSELERFCIARAAGAFDVMGNPPHQLQKNFELRIREQEALLGSLVSVMKLHFPEQEIKGAYEVGDEYGFYRDLTSLVQTATCEVFIVDAYLDEQVFNLYVSKVPIGASVRILTNRLASNVGIVAKMYATSRKLELRSSGDIHDRAVFVDQRGWVIGQSIKDAAKKKPTYMIELDEPVLAASRNAYDQIWSGATSVV